MNSESKLLKCFSCYIEFTNTTVSRLDFVNNLAEKLNDAAFVDDITPLLPRARNSVYDAKVAGEYVQRKIISCLS